MPLRPLLQNKILGSLLILDNLFKKIHNKKRMTAPFQKALLLFFIVGIAALLYGLWATTPRAPKPGSCKILEEKFCKEGKTVKDGVTTYFGFNLPAETPIFARINGFSDKTKEDGIKFSGFRAVVRDNIGGTTYRGDLRFDNLLSKDVKEGEIIGYIGSTGVKSLGYNLLITITKRTPDGPVVDEAKLKELFPIK